MKNLKKIILLTGLSLIAEIASATALCSYQARISDNDKKNSSGASLNNGANKSTVAAFIRQDRANYHQFNLRDPEDQSDCNFSTKENRAKIDSLIKNSNIDQAVINQITSDNPIIKVDVFSDKLEIAAAKTTAPPQKNPSALNESQIIDIPFAKQTPEQAKITFNYLLKTDDPRRIAICGIYYAMVLTVSLQTKDDVVYQSTQEFLKVNKFMRESVQNSGRIKKAEYESEENNAIASWKRFNSAQQIRSHQLCTETDNGPLMLYKKFSK